jgi:hypothetical protein
MAACRGTDPLTAACCHPDQTGLHSSDPSIAIVDCLGPEMGAGDSIDSDGRNSSRRPIVGHYQFPARNMRQMRRMTNCLPRQGCNRASAILPALLPASLMLRGGVRRNVLRMDLVVRSVHVSSVEIFARVV